MEQIWWERVPNARQFAEDIAESLLDEQSIVLQYDAEMPWYSALVDTVRNAVMEQNASRRFETLRHIEDPGAYLLRTYCKPEKRAQYRPSRTYARFLGESTDIVLCQRYIWVYCDSQENLDVWEDFVSDYVRAQKHPGDGAVFVLEMGGAPAAPKRGLRMMSFDAYIGEYDRIVFASLAASRVQEKPVIKNYLAELASAVAGNDIELCAACLSDFRAFMEDPYGIVEQIGREQVRSNGESFEIALTRAEMQQRIWQAQVRTIYPVIEAYRGAFVQQHAELLRRELPIPSGYGEMYRAPEDIELGTLVYIFASGRQTIPQSEYSQLCDYRDARNLLAHSSTLSMEEIDRLVSR